MFRTLSLTTFWITLSLTLIAQDTKQDELKKKPQYERLLKGDDAKKAEELEKRIEELEATDEYASAIQSTKELLALRRSIIGDDHYKTIDSAQHLEALNKISALDKKERISWRTVTGQWSTAKLLESNARYSEAAPIRTQILDINRNVLGEHHRSTARAYNNLAMNLSNQGKSVDAQLLNKKALEIRIRILGEDHPDTAVSYNNVGFILDSLGKYEEAQQPYMKALEIRIRVFGEDHPDTAQSLNNVAFNLGDRGKASEAEPLFQKALKITRRLLGEYHADTARGYNNLAFNLNAQGKVVEAHPLFQKALDISRKVVGEDHPNTAASYNNVGASLKSLGKIAEAQPLFQKALEINRKVLGEYHVFTAQCYGGAAMNLNDQGKISEAQPLFQRALDITRKVLGENHNITAQSYSNTAHNLDLQGKAFEAESLHLRALEISLITLGKDHPQSALCYNNSAFNLSLQGKPIEAQPLFEIAMDISFRVLGANHPDLAQCYNNVAMNLVELGQAEKARTMMEKALEIRRTKLGELHPDTAESYDNVAYILYRQGKVAEALPLYKKSLDVRRKLLGNDHPQTVQSFNNVAFAHVSLGQLNEARTVLTAGINAFEASRLKMAQGLERGNLTGFNPRLLLSSIQLSSRSIAAWEQVERTLARSLLDQAASDNTTLLTRGEQQLRQSARENQTGLQPRILKLMVKSDRSPDEERELERILSERRAASETISRLAAIESERSVVSGDRIVRTLKQEEALLLWMDVFDKSDDVHFHFACVVRSSVEPKWERLPGTGENGKWTKEDSQLPGQLRNELSASDPSQRTIESLAKRLHTQRIAPVLKHLDGVKTLNVVGVNEMAGIPISLLTDQFTINYVPSGTYLVRLKDQPKPTATQFLALGDAIYETEKAKITAPTALPPGGILVTIVVPDSVAAKARIQSGDVLLKYGEAELKNLDSLKSAIEANMKADLIPVTVWRESSAKPIVLEVRPGRMGVAIDPEPAPKVIANRRKIDTLLASRGGDWNDLPGTRIETNRLKQLFGENAKIFTDGNASEQTLESLRKSGELSKYRYLHFATHGEGNNVKAFESSLILSQDQLPKELMPKAGEPFLNGQLSAREVLDYWKLNADLVTLSACETAIGKQGGGDGLLGFAQAFLTAGARSVCLSLWKVDDTATALLMSRFYENLLGKREGLSKPMGKAAALDEAKRWLRGLSQEEALKMSAAISGGVDRGSRGAGMKVKPIPKVEKGEKPFVHPKYWAAFILIGDPN